LFTTPQARVPDWAAAFISLADPRTHERLAVSARAADDRQIDSQRRLVPKQIAESHDNEMLAAVSAGRGCVLDEHG
jgi:hypothetical protein